MNKPLIYYSLSIFIGCISSQAFTNNILLGAVLTASFLFIMFFTLNKKFFIICTLFFLMGMISFRLYFNIDIVVSNNNTYDCIRVIDKKDFYYVGSYKGRKLLLKGNTLNIKEGSRINVSGEYKNDRDYYRGIVGTIKITKFKEVNKDLIFYFYELKRKAYESFKEEIGDENTALIMSLCFGDTNYLTQEQKNE